MRNTEEKKKLKLNRESLRRLGDSELRNAGGGYTSTFPPTVSSRVQQC